MSQPDYDEYNHLVFEEKIATICAATIPFAAFFGLCLCLKLCCCLCDLSISRDRLRHPRGSNEPPDIGSVGRRQSLGEQPRIWDVSTAPRFPPRSEPGPQSESPGLGQGQGEDERHDVDSAADDREGTEWTEFLPLSADKVSDADAVVPSPQANSENSVRSTSSTRVQVSVIIFMPAPLTPPNPVSCKIYHSPGGYALGTSYIPYDQDD